MPIQLNKSAYAYATSQISRGAYDTSPGWDFSTEEEDKILGSSDNPDWEKYSKHFLAEDTGVPNHTKGRWKYPFIPADNKVSRAGLIAIRQRARQQGHAETLFAAAGRLINAIDVKEHGNSQQGKLAADGGYLFTFDAPPILKSGGTLGAGMPVTFGGTVYSGGVIPRFANLGDCVIDLSSITLPDKIFALVNHDPDQRAGFGNLSINNGALTVDGTFSNVTEEGKKVASELAEGMPWCFSLGINGDVEQYKKPTEVNINGQTLTVDTVFRNSRTLEFSFVPAGADPDTHASLFAARYHFTDLAHDFDLSLDLDPEADIMAMTDEEKKQMEDMKKKCAALEAKVEELTAAAEKAKAKCTALAAEVRTRDVQSLFIAMGREFKPEIAAPYMALPDEQFVAIAADLKANQPKSQLPGYLFGAPHTDGKPADEKGAGKASDLNPVNVFAAREKARLAAIRGGA